MDRRLKRAQRFSRLVFVETMEGLSGEAPDRALKRDKMRQKSCEALRVVDRKAKRRTRERGIKLFKAGPKFLELRSQPRPDIG